MLFKGMAQTWHTLAALQKQLHGANSVGFTDNCSKQRRAHVSVKIQRIINVRHFEHYAQCDSVRFKKRGNNILLLYHLGQCLRASCKTRTACSKMIVFPELQSILCQAPKDTVNLQKRHSIFKIPQKKDETNRIPNIRCFSSIEKTRIVQNMRSFLRPSQSAGNDIGSLKEASLRSERERESGKECIKRKRKSTIPKDCMSYSNNTVYFKEIKHEQILCSLLFMYRSS